MSHGMTSFDVTNHPYYYADIPDAQCWFLLGYCDMPSRWTPGWYSVSSSDWTVLEIKSEGGTHSGVVHTHRERQAQTCTDIHLHIQTQHTHTRDTHIKQIGVNRTWQAENQKRTGCRYIDVGVNWLTRILDSLLLPPSRSRVCAMCCARRWYWAAFRHCFPSKQLHSCDRWTGHHTQTYTWTQGCSHTHTHTRTYMHAHRHAHFHIRHTQHIHHACLPARTHSTTAHYVRAVWYTTHSMYMPIRTHSTYTMCRQHHSTLC